MIHWDDRGAQPWNSIHVTHRTSVAELIDVDNVGPKGTVLTGFDMFRYAGESLDELIRKAREARKRVLPIGSGWALSEINITDGWLVNTKLMNGCYDIGDDYFEDAYPASDRRYVVLAQSGMQIAELNAYLELIPHDIAKKRALKAAGIGNGQTIAGAVSGNTHGSQINFGAMSDFVVGLHIATGSGRTLWIEKASKPVLNRNFWHVARASGVATFPRSTPRLTRGSAWSSCENGANFSRPSGERKQRGSAADGRTFSATHSAPLPPYRGEPIEAILADPAGQNAPICG